MTIEATEVEWGVSYTNLTWGTRELVECIDETEARNYARLLSGQVVCRTVMVTAWAEAPSA